MQNLMSPSEDEVVRSEPVTGSLFNATAEGFRMMLVDINKAHANGYELITIVRLDKKIAAVLRRTGKPVESYGSFLGDESEQL